MSLATTAEGSSHSETTEVTLQSNRIRANVAEIISPIRCYEIVEGRNIVIVTRDVPKSTLLPHILFPTDQKPLSDFPSV